MSPLARPPALPARRSRDPAGGRAGGWLALFLAAVTLPLLALLPAAGQSGAGFGWDFAMAIGYASAAMFGVQFALTARCKRATAPFGIDLVYRFHRHLAVAALALLVLHVVLVYATVPAMAGSHDPRLAPLHMTAGRLAIVCFVLAVVLSLARKPLRLPYEAWRITHTLLATAGLALALAHVFGAGRYLDTPWKQALWVAYGGFCLSLIVWLRAVRPWRQARAPWRVTRVQAERGRVTTLQLAAPAGRPLRFEPGQFVWLSLARSPWRMQEHPFSIASAAGTRDTIELSIKALGDFSSAVSSVQPGTRAWVDGPYGTFGIDQHPDAPGYAFVAGGVGSAPVLSMLRTLAERADRRPLALFYGNRRWERVAFREELDALASRLDLRVVHVLQEPPLEWHGEHGLITRDVLARHLPGGYTAWHWFVCGPTPMTRLVERHLADLDVPARQVHSEIFDWV